MVFSIPEDFMFESAFSCDEAKRKETSQFMAPLLLP